MAWTDYGVEPFDVFKSTEFKLVWDFYEGFNQRANRSHVSKINHIIEGIGVLEYLNADTQTIRAFCLHPLLQMDDDITKHILSIEHCSSIAVALAVEYRNCANAYLCRPETDHYTDEDMPNIPLPQVQQMLVADKVQNFKDFLIHHYQTHERNHQLYAYFVNWLTHLGYTQEDFNDMSEVCRQATNNVRSKVEPLLARSYPK